MEGWNPESRAEEIIVATIDGTEYESLPQSRLEYLLLELKKVIEEGSGGGGGTTNYNSLDNKPQINSVELTGNKSLMDLGMFKGTHAQWEALSTADKCKYSFTYFTDDYEDGVVVDVVEDANMNPVTSNAVADAISNIRPRIKKHVIILDSVTAGTEVTLGSVSELTDGNVSYYASLFGIVKNTIAGASQYDVDGVIYPTISNDVKYLPKVSQSNVYVIFSLLY